MTTIESPTDDRLPWYRYVGPWEFRPVISFLALTIWFTAISTGARALEDRGIAELLTFLEGVAGSVIAASACLLVLSAGRRWQGGHGVTTRNFLTTLLIASLVTAVVRFLTFPADTVITLTASVLLVIAVRVLAVLVLVQAIAGTATWRLKRQVRRTQEALAIARQQQFDLVRADEEVRRQMASVLHDQVQSGLIAVCLRLTSVTGRVPDSERAVVLDAVERLEQMRTMDVRSAVRRLSPSLDEVDLQSAIEEMAATYEPALSTRVDVGVAIDKEAVDRNVRLAIYRIVEQGLMNAVVHGKATEATVTVELRDGRAAVKVTNTGEPLPAGAVPEGMGVLLVSTWARALNGTWSLSSENGSTQLFAEFPVRLQG